jgi:dihydroorotase
MIAREIALARLTGARIHIAHLSTRQGVMLVKRAKEEGIKITAEVTPHHLMLNELSLLRSNHTCVHHQHFSDYKMAPPLRSEEDQEALLQGLNSGVIDLIASDHAPHGCVEKEVELELAANGILGLQTTLPLILGLVHAQKISLSRAIEALTLAPAKLLGLATLGTLRPGNWADLTVVDLNAKFTLTPTEIESLSKNSPFLGREFSGKVLKTMVGGEWK